MSMGTIMPESELLRRAAAWICGERDANPEKSLHSLLDEAGMRFNLGPSDQHLLAELMTRKNSPITPPGGGRPL